MRAPSAPTPSPTRRRGWPPSREAALALVVVATIAVCSVLFPYSFRSVANFQAVLRNLAVDGILASGMMLLMIAGVFDLSVGAMMSLAAVVTGWLLVGLHWPVPAAIAAGLGVGALGGWINGFVIARVRVNPLITTLATMGIFQGLAVLLGGPGIGHLPEAFARLGQTKWLGMETPVWGLLGLALLADYALRHTYFFRLCYFVGSNPRAARLSGIDVERVRIVAFTLMGVIAALAGLAFAARVGAAVSNAGTGAELRVITAVILGGASLTGGRGTIVGALLGVVFMALVNNVLLIAQVSSYWQGIVLGVVLVLAVALDSLLHPRTD